MGQVVANAYKGKIQTYWEQARDTSSDIGLLLLQSAGLEADGALQDYTTVAALLAASNDEATFTNYARKILASPTVTIDNTLDQLVLTVTGPVQWTAAGTSGATGNNTLGKAVFYYDPAPGSSTDTTRLPLVYEDISGTTDGSTMVVSINPAGVMIYKNTT